MNQTIVLERTASDEVLISPVRIVARGPTLKVTCPYNVEFIAGAKAFGGRFILSTRTWMFRGEFYRAVLDLCCAVFGEDMLDARILLVERRRLLARISEIDQLVAHQARGGQAHAS